MSSKSGDGNPGGRGVLGRISLVEKGLMEQEAEILLLRIRLNRYATQLRKRMERLEARPPGSKPKP